MYKKGQFAIIFLAVLLSACAPVVTATQAPPASLAPSEAPAEEATTAFEPIDVIVGTSYFSSYFPIHLAEYEGFYEEQGLNVEFVTLGTTQDALVALLQGDIDVYGTSLTVAPFVVMAEGESLKFVADKAYLDPNGCPYTAWMARPEVLESGQLDDLSNLADLKVNFTLQSDYAMDVLLRPVGLTTEDLQFVDVPFTNLIDAFQTGAVDVATSGEPLITRMLNANAAEVWMPWQDYMPEGQLALLWYGPNFLEENREAGNRFMVAYRKAVIQYNEGKTDRNVELMAEFTQQDPEEVRQMCWPAFSPDSSINFDTLIDFQEWAIGKGYMETLVPVEQFWDGSFLDYANSHLE